MKKKQTTLYLLESEIQALKIEAAKKGVSYNTLIRNLIISFLENQKKDDKINNK